MKNIVFHRLTVRRITADESLSLVVEADGFAEFVEEVGQGGFDAIPVGNERGAERVLLELFRGETDAADERGDRRLLFVAGISEPVEGGVGGVEAEGVLGLAHVGAHERIEEAGVEFDALGGHALEKGAGDVCGHFVQAPFGIAGGEFLVFVIVVLAELGLADCAGRTIADHLGKHADLEGPVRRDPDSADDIKVHGKLAGQRVTEGIHVNQIRVLADDALQGAEERGDEQTHHAAVEAVGDARVVAFAKIEAEAWVGDRITKPGEQFTIVGEDVAVVDGDHARFLAGEHVAEAGPDVAALARLAGAEFCIFEFFEQLLHARTVVPEEHRFLRQLGKEAPGFFPAAEIGPVDADDDFFEVGNLLQLAGDAAEGFGADLANVAGENERDGCLRGEQAKLTFEPGDIGCAEAVEGGNGTCLVEIGHDREVRTGRVAVCCDGWPDLSRDLRDFPVPDPWHRA